MVFNEKRQAEKKTKMTETQNKENVKSKNLLKQVLVKTPSVPITTTATRPNLNRRSAGSNWSSVLATKSTQKPIDIPSSCPVITNNSSTDNPDKSATQLSKTAKKRHRRKAEAKNKILAMDCEMVGTGPDGNDNMLARVSIVNKNGEVLMDKFVKPREAVTNYRTPVSGIRPHDIENGEDFRSVQDEVVEMLQGKILVGHEIRSDLAVLQIKHPYSCIRDTARYKPLSRLVSNGHTPSLKRLTKSILGIEIQTGEHNSVEDARAAMSIYNRLREDWEKYIQKHQRVK